MTKHATGWQQSAVLRTANFSDVLTMQALFPEPNSYTCQFSVNSQGINTVLDPFDFIAELKWSVKGNSIRRLVTVSNGLSITGVAEAVSVRVTNSPASISLPNTGVPFLVSVLCAKGSRPATPVPPTLSGFSSVQLIAPANAVAVDIPQNAGVSSLLVTASAQLIGGAQPLNVIVRVSNSSFTLVSYDPYMQQGFVPVPPSATSVAIINNGPDPIEANIFWGIDG